MFVQGIRGMESDLEDVVGQKTAVLSSSVCCCWAVEPDRGALPKA
jgi:hypothetical protein